MTTPITTTADRLMEQRPFGYVSDGFADGLRFQHAPWPEQRSLTNSIEAVYSSSQWGALCSAIKEMAAERDALRQQLERMERRGDTFSEIIHNHCLAMSAALIERSIGQGAEAGMRWIANTLAGPGLLPDLDEARRLGGAQAWFDEKTDEEEQRRAELRAKVAAGGENGNG